MNVRRLLAGLLTLGLLVALAKGHDATSALLPAGFNADGFDDLAIGVPNDLIGPYRTGAVALIYGGPSPGLSGGNELWTQPPLLPDNDDDGDLFGDALAAGDFDGDGYYDLAIGVPSEDLWSKTNVGAVTVLYGAASGLTTRAQFWYQNLLTDAEDYDMFGSALAAGDFDGDGYDDLAVGVPSEDLGAVLDAGEVDVYYGTMSGLVGGAARQVLNQNILGSDGGAEAEDDFATALAAGDFNGDGYDDLAVGVPGEDLGSTLDVGAVDIVYGTANGLKIAGHQLWHQDVPGILNVANSGDLFGQSLATGDFNRDGRTDLAVGVPVESDGSSIDFGAVNILYGSVAGLASAGNQFLHQALGDSDLAEDGDLFGYALAAGDFDGDHYADLAIGAPFEDLGPTINAGAVSIVYGSTSGLASKHDTWFHQNQFFLPDTAELGDSFGIALASGDFNGDGHHDLAVGVPYEDMGDTPGDNGVVDVIYGATGGLGTGSEAEQLWWQGGDGVYGSPSQGDRFGWSLASIPVDTHTLYLPLVQRTPP